MGAQQPERLPASRAGDDDDDDDEGGGGAAPAGAVASLLDRLKDTKPAVRREAVAGLAHLFRAVAARVAAGALCAGRLLACSTSSGACFGAGARARHGAA